MNSPFSWGRRQTSTNINTNAPEVGTCIPLSPNACIFPNHYTLSPTSLINFLALLSFFQMPYSCVCLTFHSSTKSHWIVSQIEISSLGFKGQLLIAASSPYSDCVQFPFLPGHALLSREANLLSLENIVFWGSQHLNRRWKSKQWITENLIAFDKVT